MIVAMILYFPHTILIKTLDCFSILHNSIKKLHHQIKNKSLYSMSKASIRFVSHTIYKCYKYSQNLMEEE